MFKNLILQKSHFTAIKEDKSLEELTHQLQQTGIQGKLKHCQAPVPFRKEPGTKQKFGAGRYCHNGLSVLVS